MHERIRSLIRHLYTAAADETRWLAVLERLGDAFGGEVPGFQYRTGPDGHVRWAQFARLDPEIVKGLRGDYATQNPWIHVTRPLWAPGVVIPTHHLLPASELRRTAYYDGILRPAHLEYSFGVCLFRRGDDMLNFTVVRSRAKGPYEAHELRGVRALAPHLHRALQVSARLAELQRTRAALADGLERLQHALFLVDGSGHVIFANRAARNLTAQRDGLAVSREGVTAAAPAERLALRSLIDGAVRMSKGEGDGAGGAMCVSRPSLKQPYSVLVAPLPLDPEVGAPALATVFVADPDLTPRTSEGVVRHLYGLSAAEGRLAKALAETGSVDRAAEALSITRSTTRWHLKRIYRKTGTHHQAALVGRLLRGSSRVAAEDA